MPSCLPKFFAAVGLLCVVAPLTRAGSSNSLLDLSPDGSRLRVANADNGSVTVVDAAVHKALREIKVGEKPEGVAWISKCLAAVTVYRDNRLVFFDPEDGRIVGKL